MPKKSAVEKKTKDVNINDVIRNLKIAERRKQISKLNLGNRVAFVVQKPGQRPYVYSGLTKRLKMLLYPDTDENPWNSKNVPRNIMRKGRKRRLHYKKKTKSVCPCSGAIHGTLVHNQIDNYIKSMKTDNTLSLDEWIKKYPQYAFDRQCPQIDNCTRSVLYTILTDRRWQIVDTEFMIFDEHCTIGTSIDILCKDPQTNELILLELKTGYTFTEYNESVDGATFEPPFEKYLDSPKNRHMLQLMSMKEILKRNDHVNIKPDNCYIIRVMPTKSGQCELLPLAKWCRNKTVINNLFELFLASSANTRSVEKQKKKMEKKNSKQKKETIRTKTISKSKKNIKSNTSYSSAIFLKPQKTKQKNEEVIVID